MNPQAPGTRTLAGFCLLLMLSLIASAANGGVPQNQLPSSSPAPPVVLHEPYPTGSTPTNASTGVSLTQIVSITFNSDMDPAATVGAFTIDPPVAGGSAAVSGMVVRFTHATTPFTESTKYKVTIGTGAKDTSGHMNMFVDWIEFTTAALPPSATATSPANSATNVAVATDISVTFSVPMDTAATQTAASAVPTITGAFTWSGGDTVMVWNPTADLTADTSYTVTVSTAAKSKAGAALASPYVFSFRTAIAAVAPAVTTTSPANAAMNVAATTNILVTFSTAMDTAATQGAITSAPSFTGAYSWTSGNTILTWNPASDLTADTSYSVTVGTGAKSSAGTALPAAHTFTFKIAPGAGQIPGVSATDPMNLATGVAVSTSVAITFSMAMDASATQGAISASPTFSAAFSWSSGDTMLTWNPSADLTPDTKYTVTVGTGAKAKTGSALPSAHVFSFTTAPAGVDNTPPMVSHTPGPGVEEGTAISVTATATDNAAVVKVEIQYRVAGSGSFTPAAMLAGSANSYQFTIPASAVKVGKVEYYIEASDAAANKALSPAGAPSTLHTVAVSAKPGGGGPLGGIGASLGMGAAGDLVLLGIIVAVVIAAVVGMMMMRKKKPAQMTQPWQQSPYGQDPGYNAGPAPQNWGDSGPGPADWRQP